MKELRRLVVVIDSDPSVRKALGRLLRAAQMDVRTYASSDMYLLATTVPTPDCVIMALPLEGLADGQMFKHLAAMGGVPVVFTTTANGVDVARHATGKLSEILNKPFEDHLMLEAIRRSIDGTE